MKAYSLFLLISAQIYAQCLADECGPPPMMPAYLCSDGVTVAGPGDCIQNAAGECYWEIITCPNARGYLRSIEVSFCMDECSQYYIETEIDPGFGSINVIPGSSSIGMDAYIDRFVEVSLGHEVSCLECSAFEIEQIYLSNNCQYVVDCFQDPCLVESCPSFLNAECVSNYCGGCYADFYGPDGLVDCSSISDNNIEGRWHLVGYENNVMYQFENNYRYSIYSMDGTFGDIEDAGGSPNPYNVEEDIITIDLFFGTIVSYQMNFMYDGQVVEFKNITDGAINSTLFREGYDYIDNDYQECFDLTGLDFGVCAMALGIGYADGECRFISGCGWMLDGVDYSDVFFDSMEECEDVCDYGYMTCDEITEHYEDLHFGEYAACEFDNDCIAVWGHCDVGLGGCHYSVNEDNYLDEEINSLVDMWIDEDCMQWVCDCSDMPYAQCIENTCISSYCMTENPAGCDQTGCDEGYECVIDPNECVPSWCGCDGFYGQWFCTEDCGGGSCQESSVLGDLNSDGIINVMDIVLAVDIILDAEYESNGDLNNDGQMDVIDIVILVNLILG